MLSCSGMFEEIVIDRDNMVKYDMYFSEKNYGRKTHIWTQIIVIFFFLDFNNKIVMNISQYDFLR